MIESNNIELSLYATRWHHYIISKGVLLEGEETLGTGRPSSKLAIVRSNPKNASTHTPFFFLPKPTKGQSIEEKT